MVWIENACPIDAHRVTAPLPNNFILFYPGSEEASNQIRKIQYPTQLTIPYASSETPNSRNFMTKTKNNNAQKLNTGLNMVSPTIPYHWCTISSKYKINNKNRLKNTIKS